MEVSYPQEKVKKTWLRKLLLVFIFLFLLIILVELGVYFFKFRQTVNEIDTTNETDTTVKLMEELNTIEPGPELDNELLYEEKAETDRDKRDSFAQQVLGDSYQKYDPIFLKSRFGVYQQGQTAIMVTGVVEKYENLQVEINAGEFVHTEVLSENTPVSILAKKEGCSAEGHDCDQITTSSIDSIQKGDLVSLFYNRTNSLEPRKLWFVYKYLN